MKEAKIKLQKIIGFWNRNSSEIDLIKNEIDADAINYFDDLSFHFNDTFLLLEGLPTRNTDQEKLFYVFGVLQLVYVQQDLVTEMLKIFKLREPKKDELKNKNRYIRNELVGHPISREKSKKFKSSVLIGNFTEESLTYYKYTVNNSKSEKVLVSIPDVIRIHAKFLNYYFDKILQRIEEINKQ